MISVIIPSRNRYPFVQDLLHDLSQQEIRADEIIIVDQSDKPYPDLTCRHLIDDNIGPCHAKNIGLEKCTGEIIIFLDDDIRIETGFIKTITTPIIEGRSNVVVGAILNAEGHYRNSSYPLWKQEGRDWLLSLTANPNDPGTHQTLSFPTGCSAIHRSVFEKIGGFDEFFDPDGAGEDREYGLRIFHAGFSLLYEGKACVRHLGAPSGGRRSSATGYKYLNALEANSVYIVAKYFSWSVFDRFCNTWLRSIRHRPIVSVRSIWHILKRYQEAKEIIVKIKKIKLGNNWG